MKNNAEIKQCLNARLESIKVSLERIQKASEENFSLDIENPKYWDRMVAQNIDEALREFCERQLP